MFNTEELSEMMKHRITEKLGNSDINSMEVDVLIDEIGEVVSFLNRLYAQKFKDLEDKTHKMISEIQHSVGKAIEMERKKEGVTKNITINVAKENGTDLLDILRKL